MSHTLTTLLESISKRPGMYISSASIESVSDYLAGYCQGQIAAGEANPFSGWFRWVEMRFCISHPAWHWTRILLHNYGSDQASIEALSKLYLEFKNDQERLEKRGMEDERKRRLIAKYGKEIGCPSKTSTKAPI